MRPISGWRRSIGLFNVFLLTFAACDNRVSVPEIPRPGRVEVVAGNGQIGTVGQSLAEPVAVRVTDQHGNPLPNQPIEFRVTAGEGRLEDTSTETDEEGRATSRWILGTTAHAIQKIEVRAVGPAVESAVWAGAQGVGRPDLPAVVTFTDPAPRSGQAGGVLPEPIEVVVSDQYGNLLPGVPVRWTVRSGGGSVQPLSSVTDSRATSRATWTLGSVLGAGHVLEAAAGPSARAEIVASVALPRNVSLVITGGDGQTGPVGRALSAPLRVRLLTSTGRPIAGAAVTWSADPRSGTLAPPISITNSDGGAEAIFTVGRVAGAHQILATVDAMAAAIFDVTATACPVARLAIVRGNGQSGVSGVALGAPLVVRVADTQGRPIAGAEVSWRGPGTVAPSTTVSDAAGEASARWTPGNVAGTQTMAATIGCSEIAFSASVRKRVATISLSPANPEVVIGEALALTAVLRDEDGRALTGVPISWTSLDPSVATVTSSGSVRAIGLGTAVVRATAEGVSRQVTVRVIPPPRNPVASITVTPSAPSLKVGSSVRLSASPLDAEGAVVHDAVIAWSSRDPSIATVAADGSVRGISVGEARIRASAEGVTREVTVRVTPAGAPGVPVGIEIVSGDRQRGTPGYELDQQMVARVIDSDGNPVANAFIYWEGDGLPFVAVTSSTAEGITRNYWSLGTTPGPQRLELYTYDFEAGQRGVLLGAFTATAVP